MNIIICVYACATIPKYKNEILKIEETWGKCAADNGVKVLYFLGEEPTELIDDQKYIYLKGVNNDYLSASEKQHLGLKYIYEHVNTNFVFCCGTDTYINIQKLLLYIQKLDPNKNLYIGGHGSSRIINGKAYFFHSGGAGFILSKECLHNIYPDLSNMLLEWTNICNKSNCDLIPACDVAISYFLQNKLQSTLEIIKENDKIFACNYKGLCFDTQENCCYGKVNINNILSCHKMSLNNFDEFTNILEKYNYFV